MTGKTGNLNIFQAANHISFYKTQKQQQYKWRTQLTL